MGWRNPKEFLKVKKRTNYVRRIFIEYSKQTFSRGIDKAWK